MISVRVSQDSFGKMDFCHREAVTQGGSVEYIEYQRLVQAKIEKIVLAAYTVYDLWMTYVAIEGGFGSAYILIFNMGLFLGWLLYAARRKTYYFRAMAISCIIQAAVVSYVIQMPGLVRSLSLYLTLIILLGLYGIPEIFYTTLVSATVMVVYHVVIWSREAAGDGAGSMHLLLQVVSVYFVEYIMYSLVKKQRDANEQLLKTIVDLKEAERIKDDFLSNVSHEIRTPVNTICGMSEILLREEISEEEKDGITKMQNAGRNLMSIVGDILDFSELHSDKFGLAEETYNITSTVNDVINMTLAKKSEKKIELIVECDADIPSALIGDEQKIRRVILNLVNNAVKYTDNGGVVFKVSFRKTEYGGNLCVTVKDTGIGMRQESVEKLFTCFGQVDTRKNRQEGGLGLGLAISDALVSKMGGFITVHSDLGRGSEFQFVVPQKVKEDTPIISVHNRESIKIATYINLEQFKMVEIRDEYAGNLLNLYRQLGVSGHLCRSLAELKRRVEREAYTHIFVSLIGYREDMPYFDNLSDSCEVYVIMNREDKNPIKDARTKILYKPFYTLSFAKIFNGEDQGGDDFFHKDKFVSPGTHILVVDDNVMNIKVLEGLLKPYQIRVSAALSGREALAMITAKDYDLVFMDHMMPEMDGIETLRRIRGKSGSYFAEVPVVAFTANAVAGMREMFLEEGFDDFVAKPVEASVLERVLRRNIPESKIESVTGAYRIPENTAAKRKSAELSLGDLDTERGISYCGGMENYLEVLKMHCTEGAENKNKIQRYFEASDWKNYTILLHALKSSMLSIGAVTLSGMAKELELAGKDNDTERIRNNHAAMMDEYERILVILRSHVVTESEDTLSAGSMPVLSDAEFADLLKAFEDAVFTLDGKKVKRALEELQKYSYQGHSLKELLKPLEEKVEMSDFMSAYEAVANLGEQLKGDL